MKKSMFRRWMIVIPILAITCMAFVYQGQPPEARADDAIMPALGKTGELRIMDSEGKVSGACPLKHTSVSAEIVGFCARVRVTQEFVNPTDQKIEAVYTFPLPHEAAVDWMEMKVGDRTIRGEIKRRDEARQIYEQAKAKGHVAALLDQERPNIFTQAVANIMPGEKVLVTISYLDMLEYADGVYEFVFPMVVGPRFMPGAPTGQSGTGWSPDTTEVPDASKISPPVTPPGTRAGHDISLDVSIDAGVPIEEITSVQHEVSINRSGENSAGVSLKNSKTIPNKDFILRYRVGGDKIIPGVLAHTRAEGDGFFTLILQPPPEPETTEIIPKEMIFVIDTSGSQMGEPIEKAKETMELCIRQMNPDDTIQLIGFSNDVEPLFDKPQPNTPETQAMALTFLRERTGAGGTQMMKPILAALTPRPDAKRLRIVCFMTDGYVGNDMDILDAVKKNIGDARLFSFGIGGSVNRFLLDGLAKLGHGEVDYVTLGTPGDVVAKRFYERISNPLLTDIEIDWGGLDVTDVYPEVIPDLFDSKPVIIKGRYNSPGTGRVTIGGNWAKGRWSEEVEVTLPANEPGHDALAPLWARAHIGALTEQDYSGIQRGQADPEIEERVTAVALEFGLMSQFTSFVAVEEKVITEGGQPKTVVVPVEMPEGVSYEGIFGAGEAFTPFFDGAALSGVLLRGSASPAKSGGLGGIAAPGPAGPMGPPAVTDGATIMTPPPPPMSPATVRYHLDLDVSKPGSDEQIKQLIESWKKDGSIPEGCAAKVEAGRVEVIFWLSDASAKNIAELKSLDCVVKTSSKTSGMVLAWAPIEKLEELLKLEFVRRIQLPEYGEDK